MRQVVSRHHHDLRSVGRVNMPGFHSKVLVVTWISGDNFRIILLNCMVSSACVLRQSKIFFFTKEGRFLMLFQMFTKLTFSLSYILVIAVIAQNRIKSVLVSCSFVIETLGLTIKYSPNLKRFLSNINVVAIQNSLHRFRNTVNVRNNSKTSRWFLLIRSITCCNL